MSHLRAVKELRMRTDVHFNCAQALLCPFAQEVGITAEKAQKLGMFFGAGMLHGATCGALTGTLMILGMKGYTKAEAEQVIEGFRARHQTTECADLLAIAKEQGIVKKEHCDGLIYEMCQLLDEKISS